MPGPLDGFKVVEIGVWVAGPSCGAILADWGADVLKLEPPNGDPFRWFYKAYGMPLDENPSFELDNRGKRSIVLDFENEEGRALARQLVDRADVFISNLRPAALERWGLGADELLAANPRLVYASLTGYGGEGPDRDRPAYDIGAFWSRAGVGSLLAGADGNPPFQRGGMGDHTTGLATAGGVAAALLARERTGQGQKVSTSLMRTGLYFIGWDINVALRWGGDAAQRTNADRRKSINPLILYYRTQDDRMLWLLGLEPDRHWQKVCRAVDRHDWAGDPELAKMADRSKRSPEIVDYLDEVFASRPLDEWAKVFEEHDVWWAPVQTPSEVVNDPAAEAAGGFVDVLTPDGAAMGTGETVRMVSSPVDFSHTPWEPRGPVPALGQHTEEVLLELGYDWDRIIELKEAGAIP
jgi:crotonobetainyl-CoA:carnitine CoA-transferase CaiB-like acyl-CoA transferase